MQKGIDDFRKEIEEIDENIMKLVLKRLEISKEIGKIKANSRKSIRDFEREEILRKKWLESGINEELANKLFELLLKFSIRQQEILLGKKFKVSIVGFGGMAKKLAELIREGGHEVVITGHNIDKAKELASMLGLNFLEFDEAIRFCDFLILALNREGIEKQLSDFYEEMKGKVVMDILSTKTGIFEILEEASLHHSFKYVSLHPLFGPTADPFNENIVIIPSISSKDILDSIVEFWSQLGLRPIVCSLEEHEKAMALVQVLPHIHLLSIKQALEDLSEKYGINYRNFLTRNMRELLNIIQRIESNLQVIKEIQLNNPYAKEVRRKALEILKENIERFEQA